MIELDAAEAFRGAQNTVRIVGHRGARGVLPENSMIGFEFAINTGVKLLEFDVVMTADFVPVITHNHRLHAPTFRGLDGHFITEERRISELTWDEVRQYEIGWIDGSTAYGQRFPDQAQVGDVHVPKLEDLLTLVSHPQHSDTFLMLEIKSDPQFVSDPRYRERLVAEVVEVVRRTDLSKRTVLHSFDWDLLKVCQAYAPDLPTSFLTYLNPPQTHYGEDSSRTVSPEFTGCEETIPQLVKDAGGKLWCPYFEDVSQDIIDQAKELGLIVAVWTVNEPADIKRMLGFGVDAIVTDYPGRVQRLIADYGYRIATQTRSTARLEASKQAS
jgi:glycerophosphoryl diester phosphodiesterase